MITEEEVEETVNGNLDPGHPNDLVDRVGELEKPEPLKKAKATKAKPKAKK